jgi:hypothetical protein
MFDLNAFIMCANARRAATGICERDYRPPGCFPELLLVPGPTLPSLDGLAIPGF